MLQFIFLGCLLFQNINAFPLGAPTSACESMMPSHSSNQAKTEPSPFNLKVEIQPIENTRESEMNVEISSPVGSSPGFKGFLVQIQSESKKILGQWEGGSADSKTIGCGGVNNAATHTNNTLKKFIQLKWKGISETDNVYVVYTIVETYPVFWVQQKSGVIDIRKKNTYYLPDKNSNGTEMTTAPEYPNMPCPLGQTCDGTRQPNTEVPGHPGYLPDQPGRPGSQAGQPGSQPGQPGSQPGQPGSQPDQPGSQPGQPGSQPGQPGSQPGQPGSQPGQPGSQPGQPGSQPGQPGSQPDQPGSQPNQPGIQPNQPGSQPNQPGSQPGQPGSQPGQPGSQPGQPGSQPGQPGNEPGSFGQQPGQTGQPGQEHKHPGLGQAEQETPGSGPIGSNPDHSGPGIDFNGNSTNIGPPYDVDRHTGSQDTTATQHNNFDPNSNHPQGKPGNSGNDLTISLLLLFTFFIIDVVCIM